MYLINERQRQNILMMLDRATITGMREVEIFQDCIIALNTKAEAKEDNEGEGQ